MFEVGQFEGIVQGVCHNFSPSPALRTDLERLRKSGALQFEAFGHQSKPYPIASAGTYQLSDDDFLIDNVDRCEAKEAGPFVGRYELRTGDSSVVVTGIRKSGSRAHVDFIFHFENMNPIVATLGEVKGRKSEETEDRHTTRAEKLLAPYWGGIADFTYYDDGWRITSMKLNWDLGPEWPDPEFKWPAADEDENGWIPW